MRHDDRVRLGDVCAKNSLGSHDVPGDGNCLFHCLLMIVVILGGTCTDYMDLKNQVRIRTFLKIKQ